VGEAEAAEALLDELWREYTADFGEVSGPREAEVDGRVADVHVRREVLRRRRLVRMVFGFETLAGRSPSRRLVVRALIANRSIFLSFLLSFFLPFLVIMPPSSGIIYTQAPPKPKPMHSNRNRPQACQSYRS
jgi:hypothetical protein